MARPRIREGSIRANLAAHFGLAADKMVALSTTIHAKESIMTTQTHPVLTCTRFRRHRVRCFDGAGGGSWRDGSLRGSSSLRLCA